MPENQQQLFLNNPVDISRLPVADQVDWQPLHPKTRVVALLTGLFPLVGMGAIMTLLHYADVQWADAWLEDPVMQAALLLTAGLLALNLVRQQVAISYRDYALREHDVQYRRGIFFRQRTAVPINRIQHVEVMSGPLERYFALARLKLYTAGTGFGDLTIRGLHHETATRMRRYLLSRHAAQANNNSIPTDAG